VHFEKLMQPVLCFSNLWFSKNDIGCNYLFKYFWNIWKQRDCSAYSWMRFWPYLVRRFNNYLAISKYPNSLRNGFGKGCSSREVHSQDRSKPNTAVRGGRRKKFRWGQTFIIFFPNLGANPEIFAGVPGAELWLPEAMVWSNVCSSKCSKSYRNKQSSGGAQRPPSCYSHLL